MQGHSSLTPQVCYIDRQGAPMKNANTIEFTPYENYDRIEPVGDVSPESYYAVYSEYFRQRQGRARVFILNDIQNLTSVLGSEGYLELAKLAADNNIGHIYLASVTLDKGRPMHGKMIKSMLAAVGVAITPEYFDREEEAISWLTRHSEEA